MALFREVLALTEEIKGETVRLDRPGKVFHGPYDDESMREIHNAQHAASILSGFIKVRALVEAAQNHLAQIDNLVAINLSTRPVEVGTWLNEDAGGRQALTERGELEAGIISTIASVDSQTRILEQVVSEAFKFGDDLRGRDTWLVVFRHLLMKCESALSATRYIHEDVGPECGQRLCNDLAAIFRNEARDTSKRAREFKRRRVADGSYQQAMGMPGAGASMADLHRGADTSTAASEAGEGPSGGGGR